MTTANIGTHLVQTSINIFIYLQTDSLCQDYLPCHVEAESKVKNGIAKACRNKASSVTLFLLYSPFCYTSLLSFWGFAVIWIPSQDQ